MIELAGRTVKQRNAHAVEVSSLREDKVGRDWARFLNIGAFAIGQSTDDSIVWRAEHALQGGGVMILW